jgi:hypothetical protein
VVLSTQHNPDKDDLRVVMELIITSTSPAELLQRYHPVPHQPNRQLSSSAARVG